MFRLLICSKESIIIFEKIITFKLEYNPNIEDYKAIYNKLSLISYGNSNYASNNKSKQLIIGYIYYLNKAIVF